ncbi:hypothetical protein KP509_30G066900 [Ceratopteris richardii]|uniref:Uncharacterized protein n=1 Tax=Ceratopteris richardii TaxID=49495 RepID=A0A8T2R4G2_CERRI|nr:hypothetical protein KP509_30G066900 [Ceratopteris richardii]
MSMLGVQMQRLGRRWFSKSMRRGALAAAGGVSLSSSSQSGAFRSCRQLAPFSTSTNKVFDTHFLTNEEIQRQGIQGAKRPPGEGPGEYMHQRKHFGSGFFKSKEMIPVYPLLFMLTVAFGLATVTMYRELVEYPTVIVKKQKRREHAIPELEQEADERLANEMVHYYESSPMRRMAFGKTVPKWIKRMNSRFFQMPPALPGSHPSWRSSLERLES